MRNDDDDDDGDDEYADVAITARGNDVCNEVVFNVTPEEASGCQKGQQWCGRTGDKRTACHRDRDRVVTNDGQTGLCSEYCAEVRTYLLLLKKTDRRRAQAGDRIRIDRAHSIYLCFVSQIPQPGEFNCIDRETVLQ
jgi:hypothetical protein